MRYLILLLLLPSIALATGYPPKGNDDGQQQSTTVTSTTTAVVTGTQKLDSDNRSSSSSGGNNLSVDGGESKSRADASGGAAEATGGAGGLGGEGGQGGTGLGVGVGGDGGSAAGGAGGVGGKSSAVSGNSSANGGGAIVSNSYRESIAMAAPIYAGPCSEGFSGSGEDGGFSIQTINQYCQRINQANVMLAAWQFELNHNSEPWCDGVCTTKEASVTLNYKVSDKAMEFEQLYYENLYAAQAILDKTETTGLVGRWFQQMGGIVIAVLLVLAV